MKIRTETEKTPKGADLPEFRTNCEQMKSLGWEDFSRGWWRNQVTGEMAIVSHQGYASVSVK